MSALETPLPQCTYVTKKGKEREPCPLCATYVILAPPVTTRLTPTPVWLPGEKRTPSETKRRPVPLYCQVHAYQMCKIALQPGPL